MSEFKVNLKEFFRKPLNTVILVGLMLIPTIYAALFLSSNWDPYGRTENLKVAVVNQDSAYRTNDGELNLGKALIEELKKDKNLSWTEMREAEAIKRLKDGDLFMAIVIPDDFSENSANLLEAGGRKMSIKYYTNEGHNYIAKKITDSASKEIVKSITQSIGEKYVGILVSGLGEARDGMKIASDGAQKLERGIGEAVSGSAELNSNFQIFKEKMAELSAGAVALESGLAELDGGGKALFSGVDALSNGFGQVSDGANALSLGVKEYAGGVAKLESGANDLNDGYRNFYSAIGAYMSGNSKISESADQLESGAESFSSGFDSYREGVIGLHQGLDALKRASYDFSSGLGMLQSGENGVPGLIEYQKKLNREISDLKSAVGGGEDAPSLEAIEAVKSELELVKQNPDMDAGRVDEILSRAQSALDGYGDVARSNQLLTDSLSGLESSGMQMLEAETQTLSGINSLNSEYSKIEEGLEQASGSSSDLVDSGYNLDSGAKRLYSGISMLNDGAGELVSNNAMMTEAGADLSSATEGLAAGAAALSAGSNELTDGAGSLVFGVDTFGEGLSKVEAGSSELSGGITKAGSGASELSSGSDQLSSGSEKLAQGTLALDSGINALSEGTMELSSGLSEGAEKLAEFNPEENSGEKVSSPVEVQESRFSKVEDYGTALAPYMMSVGLFAGAIALSFALNLGGDYGRFKGGSGWWLEKFSIMLLVSAGQAAIITAVLTAIGLQPISAYGLFAASFLTALAFMSIVLFCSALFGIAGSFLSMVILVLQLSASGGTFPVELTGDLFMKISPYMPMTYSVGAFKKAISLGESISGEVAVLVFIVAAINLALLLVLKSRQSSRKPGGTDVL